MDGVFVGLGSNIGDRLGFLQNAVACIGRVPDVALSTVSSVYETEPVGNKDQPPFLNAVVGLSTTLTAEGLLRELKDIERTVGRTPTVRWGPREIDLDLLYFGDQVLNGPKIAVPHPEAIGRRFVLTPLTEIAPGFVDPLRKRTVRDLLRHCPDLSSVTKTTATIHLSAAES